jgi:integrase
MAKRLTDKQVAELKRKPTRYVIKDPELRGHYVRIPPEGPAVFAAVARTPSRKQVWVTLGTTADLKIGEARERAQKALRRIKDGLPATETKPESVPEVTEGWLKRHVDQKKLRTADEYRRIVDRYILPKWKDRIFVDLRRSDIAALMDTIEDKHGARQADMVLTTLSSIAAWVHKRDDSYTPPFARGMRRAARGGRERVLSDEEIRRIWSVCDRPELYPIGPIAQLLLLTAQRRQKVCSLKWVDIRDGVWTIDTEPLEKSNAGTLRLPKLALDILYAQPKISDRPYIFSSLNGGPWGVSSKLKARLDQFSGVSGWTLHDLRRTAKTLMARADVRPDISERVLGHQIKGVEAIYDRHRYEQQKADALTKLSEVIKQITSA